MPIRERKRVGATVQEWTSERGSLRCERLGREVLVFRAQGYLEAEFVDLFEQFVDEAIAETRPHLFWDGLTMTGYESEFRQRIGSYCVKVKDRVRSMQVYTPNRMVAMGASVINMWLGGFFTILSSHEELERRIADARSDWRA